jgi:hypothetical protein
MENYNKVVKGNYAIHYYLNDKLHRLDGPAQIWFDGLKLWYQNGLLHRTDGPAREFRDGYKDWWFEDKQIDCTSQKEFERYLKLKLFW